MRIHISADKSEHRSSKSLVRLFSGVMTATEEREFRGWRESDVEFNEAFQDSAYVLAKMQGLEDDPDILAMMDEPAEKAAVVKVQKYWRPLAVAASLTMALAISLLVIPELGKDEIRHDMSRYVTRMGEQKQVELSDGSVIHLNTATQLLVDITDSTRRVIFERGEAYFDVAKDPSRPFSVELGEKTVSVLGTAFNILKSPEGYKLAVLEGVVALHDHNEPVSQSATILNLEVDRPTTIEASKQLRVVKGQIVEHNLDTDRLLCMEPESMSTYSDWRTGFLQFDDIPLSEVAQKLNRYMGKKVLIEDAEVLDLKIVASMRVSDLESALNGLEVAYPIKIIRYFDRIVIKGKR